MKSAFVIAGLTVREAARRKILTLGALLGLLFLALYGTAVFLLMRDLPVTNLVFRQQGLKVLLCMGLYAVNFLMVMVTVLVSVDTLSGEIASGTMQTIVSRPIRRWQVVVGKWLGFISLLTVYLLCMAGGVAALVWTMGGFSPRAFPAALALMWLECLLLLSLTFLAGTRLSTLATGVCVIGLHGLAFLGGWIEEFGALGKSHTATMIGVVASVLMPSESLWRRAAYEIQHPLFGMFGAGPFSSGSVPSGWMIGYAALYAAAAFALALRQFSKRDL